MNGKRQIFRVLAILVVASVVYWRGGNEPVLETAPPLETPREKGTAILKDGPIAGVDDPKPEKDSAVLKKGPIPGIDEPKPKAAPKTPKKSAAHSKVGVYDKLTNVRLIDRDGNDGDSFLVRTGSREFELRLYFVDAPESYLSDRHADQRRRVGEQARELGGITPDEAVEVGKRAKAFAKQQLGAREFTVYTYWEEVYDGDRFYGFVELPDGSDLGTRLVEQGLARIHTKGPGSKEKPVPTPKGESFFQARDQLEALEAEARKAKRGAWAY